MYYMMNSPKKQITYKTTTMKFVKTRTKFRSTRIYMSICNIIHVNTPPREYNINNKSSERTNNEKKYNLIKQRQYIHVNNL